MFSVTTMASSTTMPTARVSAERVITLSDWPKIFITARVAYDASPYLYVEDSGTNPS